MLDSLSGVREFIDLLLPLCVPLCERARTFSFSFTNLNCCWSSLCCLSCSIISRVSRCESCVVVYIRYAMEKHVGNFIAIYKFHAWHWRRRRCCSSTLISKSFCLSFAMLFIDIEPCLWAKAERICLNCCCCFSPPFLLCFFSRCRQIIVCAKI